MGWSEKADSRKLGKAKEKLLTSRHKYPDCSYFGVIWFNRFYLKICKVVTENFTESFGWLFATVLHEIKHILVHREHIMCLLIRTVAD